MAQRPPDFVRYCRRLRKSDSLLRAHPVDAYRYLLFLVGKSDSNLTYVPDATVLLFMNDVASQGSYEDVVELISFLETSARSYHATVPTGEMKAAEIYPKATPRSAYRDLIYSISFGADLIAASTFYSELQKSGVLPLSAVVILARHAFAAVQMLAKPRCTGFVKDDFDETDSVELVRLCGSAAASTK